MLFMIHLCVKITWGADVISLTVAHEVKKKILSSKVNQRQRQLRSLTPWVCFGGKHACQGLDQTFYSPQINI